MAKKLYGTDPDQVPTNADLGTMAYQDKDNASISKIQVENDGDLQLNPDGGKITVGANNFDATSGDLQGIANLYGRGTGSTKTFAKLTFQNSNDSGGSYAQIQARRIDSNYGAELWFYINPQGVAQSPTHVMTLKNGGDLAVIDGNVVMANGHGIDFSASEGSGASSSILDDYEEGTWTPSYSSSGASFTYNTQYGSYVKVGNIVHAQFYLNATVTGTTSNSTEVQGLPFTAANLSPYHQWSASCWFSGSLVIQPLTGNNSTAFALWKNGAVSTAVASDVGGSRYLVGHVTYRTT